MKYVIAYNKLTLGTSPSVSNPNVKHIQIYLQGKIKIQGFLASPFRDPLPIFIAILTGCYILTIKYSHILSWNLLARQNFPNYMVLNINYCNSFSFPIYIQVIIQRCAIKKVNQPTVEKNNFANVNCCKHKNARNLMRTEVRTTNNEQPTTNYEKKLVCKRTKISATSSTNLLYSIFARAWAEKKLSPDTPPN